MKNVKKYVLAALMVAVMAFALCACGGSNVDGTYVVSEYNGQDLNTALEQLKAAGMDLTADTFCTFKLEGGKNLTVTFMGTSKSGTYSVSGETLTMTIDNESTTANIKDGVISWTMGNETLKLKKK